MRPEIFRIPFINHPIYGYGLMLVIGFLCAAQLARFLARRCGLNGDVFVNAGLLALASGVIGARLSHILESLADPANTEFARNGHSLKENLWSMVNVSSGGLTFYGGFLVATPILMYYAIRKKIPLLKGMDIIAPCLMIGLAFGRIGCYLNGCCYGEECNVSWGAAFPYGSNAFVEQYENGELSVPRELTDPNRPDANGRPGLVTRQQLRDSYAKLDDPLLHLSQEERAKRKSEIERQQRLMDTLRAKPVHPTELYSAFNSFLVAGVLVAFFSLAPAPGRVFALMLLFEGASRYILEMLRVEPPVFGTTTQSFSMILSATFVVIGAVMWFACGALSDTTPRKHAPASA